MARGQPWTPEQDAAIAKAAALTRKNGLYDPDIPYGVRRKLANRLGSLAGSPGFEDRTPDAVRKRAQRIAERSYTTWDPPAPAPSFETAKPQAAGAGRGGVAKARRDAGLCLDCGGPAPRSPKYMDNVAKRIEREKGIPFERLMTYPICGDCLTKREARAAARKAKARGRAASA